MIVTGASCPESAAISRRARPRASIANSRGDPAAVDQERAAGDGGQATTKPSAAKLNSPFATRREMLEIRTCAADFPQLVAAENAPNRGFGRFTARFIRENQSRGHDKNALDHLEFGDPG